jgi:hypothetical protein
VQARNSTRIFWLLFFVALTLPGLVLLLLAVLPFSTLKPIADALAKDGSMQSFTQPVQQSLRWFVWTGCAGALLRLPFIPGAWWLTLPR